METRLDAPHALSNPAIVPLAAAEREGPCWAEPDHIRAALNRHLLIH